MNKNLRIALKAFSWVLVVIIIALAGIIAVPRLFGLKVFTVLSPSMEPEYKTGALIYVKSVEPQDIKEGEVITFLIGEQTTATHRVIRVIEGNDESEPLYFTTKGDANNSEDSSPVHEANIIGKPIVNISYLGYIVSFIQNPPGMYLSIAVGLICTIVVFMIDYLACDGQENKIGKEETQA